MRGLPRACSVRGGEVLVAGMLAAVGVLFVWQAALLDLGNVALPGPGFFPLVLGAALTIFATVIGVAASVAAASPASRRPLPNGRRWRRWGAAAT